MCVYIRGTAWETEFDRRSEGSQRLDDLVRQRSGTGREVGLRSRRWQNKQQRAGQRETERERERDVGEHGLERQD